MMRAIVQERYGSSDVLELRDVDQPVMREDQMLVRLRCTQTCGT
jgi:NADPH:quinone reductase-like Zn-dependent oxidoreductase